MPKRFTLAEAQGLIPEVDRLLREAMAAKSEYDAAEGCIRSLSERVMLMGGILVNRDDAVAARSRREDGAARLNGSIERVQQLGCVVKDLDTGLIDFPTTYRGEEVCLCWKLGETDLAFWHGVEEGFAGRKAIDQDFRDHHRGDW